MQKALSNKTIEKLKYDLVREGLITYDDLLRAEEIAQNNNVNLAQILIQHNFISEENFLDFIEAKLHIPYVNLEDYSLDKTCLELISEKDAKNFKIIPLFKIEDVLTIAMADPLDLFLLNKLTNITNFKIEPIICPEHSILKEIEKQYSNNDISIKDFNSINAVEFDWREELNDEYPDEFQIKRIIQAIFYQAYIQKTKEIFLENSSNGLTVRFLKNNELIEKGNIPILLTPMFVSKLKSISSLDSSITEIPQLGKYKFFVDSSEIIATVATFPTISGEKITIKIYTPPKKLNKLITNTDQFEQIQSCLSHQGIVVIAGNKLSGKTSLVYSMLSSLEDKQNILTLESIVKYDLPEITQCEMNENVGFSFDKAIRHIEFQSPDIVYIEEFFTPESIDYACFLAHSGKLIITEFTSSDYLDLINRLNSPIYSQFKKLITCLLYVEKKKQIIILDKDLLN